MDLLQLVIENLERGKESANQIRNLLFQEIHPEDHYKGFDDHSKVVLTTFDNALSILQGCDFQDNFRKIKVARTNDCDSHNSQCKSEESAVETPNSSHVTTTTTLDKDRRGCYKRRRTDQANIIDVPNLTDDGHAWRKYGQKTILNNKHPRNYYRCTHKTDQGCQATKQVQQISENPTKFRVIYHGQHTCKNLHKNPAYMLDPIDQDSSIWLSFGSNSPSTTKQALSPNFIFPSSPTTTTTTTSTMVKQEYESIKEEIPSGPSDLHHHQNQDQGQGAHNNLQYTSSSGYQSPVSEQGDVISSAEVYSSRDCPLDYFEEEYYNYMMAESVDFGEVFHDILFQ